MAKTKIPKSKKAPREATSGRIPRSDTDGAGDFNPFLKAEHVGRKIGATAVLVLTGKVRVADGNFGTQIISEAKLNGKVYDWAVKLNTPNHRWLESELGVNTKNWKGKKVPIALKENVGKLYVAIQR